MTSIAEQSYFQLSVFGCNLQWPVPRRHHYNPVSLVMPSVSLDFPTSLIGGDFVSGALQRGGRP